MRTSGGLPSNARVELCTRFSVDLRNGRVVVTATQPRNTTPPLDILRPRRRWFAARSIAASIDLVYPSRIIGTSVTQIECTC